MSGMVMIGPDRVLAGNPVGFQPRSVDEQMATWERLLPGLNQGDHWRRDWGMPDRGEFCGVLPSWRALAPTPREALGRMLTLLVQHGDESYNIELDLDEPSVWIDSRAGDTLIGDKVVSTGDYLIVPVQFGNRGLAEAPTTDVWSRLQSGEVVLWVHDVLALMIANPGRITPDKYLCLECAGSYAAVDYGGATMSEAITICCRSGKVVIGPHNYREETTDFGVATAFVR